MGNAIEALVRAARDSKGIMLNLHEDICTWFQRWQAELE
jgi:hypothetical protein